MKSETCQIIKDFDFAVPRTIKGIPIDMLSLRNRLLEKYQKKKTFLINMQLRNGKFTTFLIITKNQYFKYMGSTYVIDSSLSYDNINSRHYCLDYHQDFCLPIKRDFNWKEIQDGIEASRAYEIEASTNPSALTKIIEANMGEGVAKSSQIPDFIKQMKLLLIIGTMASVGMLILFVFKTGMLQGVKIPGMS